jgi:hypothetical protein
MEKQEQQEVWREKEKKHRPVQRCCLLPNTPAGIKRKNHDDG